RIEKDLLKAGYLTDGIAKTRVIEISVIIPDRPGAVLPVLEILGRYEINISYLNSSANGGSIQDFKFGLLIENPGIIKTLLDEIGQVYPINIIDCDTSEENLDNTVFYIRLANEMQSLFGLNTDKTRQFLSESNRILQALQSEGRNADTVFDYIRRFAYSVSGYRGERFRADVEKEEIGGGVTLYSVQPYCGSNTYVLKTPEDIVIIDTGYAVYADEMLKTLDRLIPGFDSLPKRVYITHADVDHCGMLQKYKNAVVLTNAKCFESLSRQAQGLPDYRESSELHTGYSKISMLISGYEPPDVRNIKVIERDTPRSHRELLEIAEMQAGGLDFSIFEGSGGHLDGEMVYVCRKAGVVFTGDILVNFSGFSRERAEFNSLAPFLMKSVNVSPQKAREMREKVTEIINSVSEENKRPCIICGGHGPLSVFQNGKLARLRA
ncbi:MAG: MBL fold metallo-hydrolase, partial [Bacillota bacterium]|nr:MBL fold metallo-hydrolase [Bacillota bacterium]